MVSVGDERKRLDSGFLTDEDTSDDSQRMRRLGGPRHNISERVTFHAPGRTIEGWALNLSRGGLRAIVEEALQVGDELEVTIGETELRRSARVVWVRDKQGDGAVVGVTFVGAGGTPPPTPSEDERLTGG